MYLKKILETKKFKILLVAGFALFVGFLLYAFTVDHTKAPDVFTVNQGVQGSGLPVRLTIPAISVDAPIKEMGLTSDGAMDAPDSPSDAGWFNLGPRPGEIGSAVIDGHFGWKNNKSAVFDNLYKVQKGDRIYVEDDTGTVTVFVVREIRIYHKDTDATDVFMSNDGKAHLNLITCTGPWSVREKTRGNRLIVFADVE